MEKPKITFCEAEYVNDVYDPDFTDNAMSECTQVRSVAATAAIELHEKSELFRADAQLRDQQDGWHSPALDNVIDYTRGASERLKAISKIEKTNDLLAAARNMFGSDEFKDGFHEIVCTLIDTYRDLCAAGITQARLHDREEPDATVIFDAGNVPSERCERAHKALFYTLQLRYRLASPALGDILPPMGDTQTALTELKAKRDGMSVALVRLAHAPQTRYGQDDVKRTELIALMQSALHGVDTLMAHAQTCADERDEAAWASYCTTDVEAISAQELIITIEFLYVDSWRWMIEA